MPVVREPTDPSGEKSGGMTEPTSKPRGCVFCEHGKGLRPARNQEAHPLMAGAMVCRDGAGCEHRMRLRLGVRKGTSFSLLKRDREAAKMRLAEGTSG